MTSSIDMVIRPRDRDIGGFSVRRLLPYASHRMVGPFIFFDHIGPAHFAPNQGIDVRPHPHMNLATVTYLFEGELHHRDSLGSDQIIRPGDINWMIAGRGIVHSERSPTEFRKTGGIVHAIQCWVAYPAELEERTPQFSHHPSHSLPEFQVGKAQVKLLLGSAFGQRSPVPTEMDIFYFECHLPRGAKMSWPESDRECALHVLHGQIQIDSKIIQPTEMAVAKTGQAFSVEALEDSHLMWLGGRPLGQRFIYWNLVSSSQERIEEAKDEWRMGPGQPGGRFSKIPGDDLEFIPLPASPPSHPKGTIF